MVSVTLAAPAPDAMVVGERVYVAPVGRPLNARFTAAGKVVAPVGEMVKLYTAWPPGNTVCDVLLPEVEVEEMARLKSFTCTLVAALGDGDEVGIAGVDRCDAMRSHCEATRRQRRNTTCEAR